MDATIRPARRDDVGPLNDIYNRYILETHVSFDTEPWSLERRMRWFDATVAQGPYLAMVAEMDGRVVGAAWSSPFRDKQAYDTSVQTTVVLEEAATGRGLGTRLLGSLLEGLSATNAHRAYAIVALPNDASIALHHKLGYRDVGIEDESGHKFGRFWSTHVLEKRFD